MRFGPGILTYNHNSTQDIGFWCGDKLVRILTVQEIDFKMPEVDPIDRVIHVNSWYDREALLYETLNPQNLFCNKFSIEQLNQFIREDPYVEEILVDKRELVDQFLSICPPDTQDLKVFKMSKFIEVPNITRNLIEIFKHTEKYSNYKEFARENYGLDLTIFESKSNVCWLFFFFTIHFLIQVQLQIESLLDAWKQRL